MNIVFFMQDTGTIFGAERATLDLAHGLREAGDVPVFFLIEEERSGGRISGLRQAIEESGFPLERFPVAGRLSWGLARRIRRAFRQCRGDVLHVIGYKANLHAWLSRVHPVVATVHGWLFRTDLKERLYDAIDRRCLHRCDRVICLSTFYERMLLSHGFSPDRLRRIPSGLRDLPTEAEMDRRRSGNVPMVFGMMGRFSEEKRNELFLRAAARVLSVHPQARFRLAGQGPLEATLRETAQSLGIALALDFCGYARVEDFFRSIDVYVICSKIENLPYSIMEAMAWNKPVIGTRVGGIPDLIDDGVTGCLVDPDDHEALAGAMMQMMEDPRRGGNMGRAGREKIEQVFDLKQSVARHQWVYAEIAGKRHD